VSDNGSSVNDYFIMSCELYALLCDSCEFRVAERIESDHMPVELHVNSRMFHREDTDTKNNFTLEKLVWNEDHADLYANNICTHEFQESINYALSLIDVDINQALNVFNVAIKNAGDYMKRKIPNINTVKPKDWFDAECHKSKKNVRKLLNKYRRTLDNGDRDCFCIARREYKRLHKIYKTKQITMHC
jgi:hypothetical protein